MHIAAVPATILSHIYTHAAIQTCPFVGQILASADLLDDVPCLEVC